MNVNKGVALILLQLAGSCTQLAGVIWGGYALYLWGGLGEPAGASFWLAFKGWVTWVIGWCIVAFICGKMLGEGNAQNRG